MNVSKNRLGMSRNLVSAREHSGIPGQRRSILSETNPVIRLPGTHRARLPEESWAIIRPLLDRYGVTRVADVTRFDVLGIPVVLAIRPLARTFTISHGKGHTPLLARLSAVMESVELWHAENACPPPVIRNTSAEDLRLPYELGELQQYRGSLLSDRTPLDWVEASTVAGDIRCPVPRHYVQLGAEVVDTWSPPMLRPSSNGLASGNNFAEAALHGLYEMIERDSVASLRSVPAEGRDYLDLGTVDNNGVGDLLGMIRKADMHVEVLVVRGRWPFSTFVAYLWDGSRRVSAGSGVHSDPAIGLSRALTEAAQSRLVAITGAHDDLSLAWRGAVEVRPSEVRVFRPTMDWTTARESGPSFRDLTAELVWLDDLVRSTTGFAPLYVDLSTHDAISVVKVVAAGLSFEARHSIPRNASVGVGR
ncbi:YcaO-like family protein [Plantactinospora sp. B5E13]|uniref:YcaO-like family protein n=1 Tax=Plantactinospora sp. B5E13 TaxID=3153758 RepID=UPI00325D54B7